MAPPRALVRYASAAAIAAAALLVRWALPAGLGPMLALFCIAVLLAALAGPGPGLLATGLLAAALSTGLLAPEARLSLAAADDQARLALLLLFGLLASLLTGRTAGALQRSTQRLLLQAEVLRHLGEAVVAIDGRQRVVYWGAGAERLYGVAEAEAIGRVVHELFTWVWRTPGCREAAYAALGRDGIWQGEMGLLLRDGRRLDAEATVTTLRPGGASPWLLSVVRDVTSQRQLEREQAAAQLRLEAALGVGQTAVFNQDGDLRYTWARPTRFQGIELVGRTDAEVLALLPLPGLADLFEWKRQVLASGVGGRREISVGEGEAARWFDVAVEPTRDAAGRITGLTTAALDVTPRRHDEARLLESREQLRALAGQLRSSREQEQIRIARDLHDGLGQALTALKMQLRQLEREVEARPAGAELNGLLDGLVAASALADDTVAAVKRIALDLRSGTLDLLGVAAALREEARRFEDRTGLPCRAEVPEDLPPLGPELPTALYRICQEALTNVARHAGACRVAVRLTAPPGQVELTVEDDGRGLDPAGAAAPGALGLLGMAERARALGGAVTFGRGAAGGTVVTARFPLPAPAPPAARP